MEIVPCQVTDHSILLLEYNIKMIKNVDNVETHTESIKQ